MDDRLQALLSRAFATAPAREANEAIDRIREERPQPARSWELLLPPDADTAWLVKVAVPRLAYHLDSLGGREGGMVFVSVFAGEELYFLEAGDVLELASSELGIPPAEVIRRFGTGELHGPVTQPAPAGAQLALPPPKK